MGSRAPPPPSLTWLLCGRVQCEATPPLCNTSPLWACRALSHAPMLFLFSFIQCSALWGGPLPKWVCPREATPPSSFPHMFIVPNCGCLPTEWACPHEATPTNVSAPLWACPALSHAPLSFLFS